MQLGDQREFVLDQRAHLVRHALWIAHRRALPGCVAQEGGRGLAVRNDLIRVLVAQLVERETALLGDCQRLRQQLGRIDAAESIQGAQVLFGVRRQLAAALRERRAQPHRCQRILQFLAAAHMHVRGAGRNQRYPGA